MWSRVWAFFLLSGLLFSLGDEEFVRQAEQIHRGVLTVDTHCDTLLSLLRPGWDIGQRHETGQPGSGRVDLPRMKEGDLDASFFAVFTNQGPLTDEGFARARQSALRQLDALDRMEASYLSIAGRALRPADARRLERQGKRAIFIGLENGYPIGRRLDDVDYFFRRGMRYLTLVHTADNQLCDSSTDRNDPQDRGLNDFGRRVVERLNQLGVMVDVSHCSDRSFFDILKASRAPVIASHSSVRAIAASPRNLSDEMLLALQRNGGVIQICIYSGYIRTAPEDPERDRDMAEFRRRVRDQYGDWENVTDPAARAAIAVEHDALEQKYAGQLATVKEAVDHIDHVVRLIGIDHVGIGTDFDGGGALADCRDVTELKNITVELVRRGYTRKQIAKIWGGNAMRVMRRAIDYSRNKN